MWQYSDLLQVLKGEHSQLWLLNRVELNFFVASTPVQVMTKDKVKVDDDG